MSMVLDWKPVNAEEAFKLLTGKTLDSPSIDHKPIGLQLEPSLSFGGDAAGKLTLNVRGSLTVAVAALWGDFYVGGSTLTVNGQRKSVPEPGTLALFGVALMGFGLLRRKRETV